MSRLLENDPTMTSVKERSGEVVLYLQSLLDAVPAKAKEWRCYGNCSVVPMQKIRDVIGRAISCTAFRGDHKQAKEELEKILVLLVEAYDMCNWDGKDAHGRIT